MKHMLLAFVVAAVCVVRADSYLYWMVGDNPGYNYSSAKLVASQSSTWSWAADGNTLGTATADEIADARGFGDGIYSSIQSYAAGYTYFVELLADSKIVAYSTTGLSYDSAASYLSSLTQFDPGASSLWTASTFATPPIPEPTSGMMLLLGVAALALRRRRA